MGPHPHEINDADVIALLDGTASEHVLDHYDECRECRAYVAGQRQIEAALREVFALDACLPAEILAAFRLDDLSPLQQRALRAHLGRCDSCRAAYGGEGASLHLGLALPDPLGLPVAVPVGPPIRRLNRVAAAPLAGEPVTLQAENDDLAVSLTFTPDNYRWHALDGQVSVLAPSDRSLDDARIVMVADGEHLATMPVEDGFFAYDRVPLGRISLELWIGGERWEIPSVDLAG